MVSLGRRDVGAFTERLARHSNPHSTPGSPQHLAELAFHFAAAGATEQGVKYALAAGDRALQGAAAREACRPFRDSAGNCFGPTAEAGQRADILSRLGDAASVLASTSEPPTHMTRRTRPG